MDHLPLEKLRSMESGGPLDRLARLVVDEDLATPVGRLIDSRFIAGVVRTGLRAWIDSDAAEGWILSRVKELEAWLAERDASVGELVPQEIQDACLELASRRYTPNRGLTLFLLDREPIRLLLRNLLMDELLAFGRKMRAPVVENPLTKGLGSLGRAAKERARTSGGAFAALAGDVVGAVSSELERQLDRKAAEFADAALSRVLQRLADLLCDPARAAEQAALRRALVEGIFDLEASEVGEELSRSEPEVASEIIRRGLATWLKRDESADHLAEMLEAIFKPDAHLPLRDVLDLLGLVDSYVELAHHTILRRLRSLVDSPAFEIWLSDLLA
ncbi:hypothetical protein [Vulgatibacter incomptus]|uniref:Uncharacterized protein n=1 Tax=Vulgatibacter incomptus TaxID=1391653 RepID=A0A0K1PHC7_9BACT|nr:hypothetical protein [Vulgatibacter incomptus]AKU92912.1 hypothetical protein AKJ08_3299 [Vulgatibacter incomptus]